MAILFTALIIFIVIYVLLFFIGLIGFRYFYKLSWLDSFMNVSNTITGNSPFLIPMTSAGKWFAGIYLIVSHIVFLILFALLVAYIIDYSKQTDQLADQLAEQPTEHPTEPTEQPTNQPINQPALVYY